MLSLLQPPLAHFANRRRRLPNLLQIQSIMKTASITLKARRLASTITQPRTVWQNTTPMTFATLIGIGSRRRRSRAMCVRATGIPALIRFKVWGTPLPCTASVCLWLCDESAEDFSECCDESIDASRLIYLTTPRCVCVCVCVCEYSTNTYPKIKRVARGFPLRYLFTL